MLFLYTFLLVFSLSFILVLLRFSHNQDSLRKRNSFECGFNSIISSSTPFSTPFFYITLIFLIFDLELALLIFYPLLNNSRYRIFFHTFFTLVLILFLTFYEWEKGLINWF